MPSFLGAYRTSSLEGYLFGGLFAWRAVLFCVCDFVFLFLSPWLDQLSLRYQMVYAIFLEIIIPIPYSILYVIYDLEGSNDVNLQSTEFDPCR
jgi:hypothetical protein